MAFRGHKSPHSSSGNMSLGSKGVIRYRSKMRRKSNFTPKLYIEKYKDSDFVRPWLSAV